jgi:hypothetical protein
VNEQDTRPPLGESLEWAESRAVARRLEALRWSYDTGWHTEYPPQTPEAPAQRIAATLLGRR